MSGFLSKPAEWLNEVKSRRLTKTLWVVVRSFPYLKGMKYYPNLYTINIIYLDDLGLSGRGERIATPKASPFRKTSYFLHPMHQQMCPQRIFMSIVSIFSIVSKKSTAFAHELHTKLGKAATRNAILITICFPGLRSI